MAAAKGKLVARVNDIPGIAQESEVEPTTVSETAPVSQVAATPDLPAVNKESHCPVVTAIVTEQDFELVVSDMAEEALEMVATSESYATFIKDPAVRECLDAYFEATSEMWLGNHKQWSQSADSLEASELTQAFWTRLKSKTESTHVQLTAKKVIPGHVRDSVRKYVMILCKKLGLSSNDTDVVLSAADIHNWARLWHPSHDQGGFKVRSEAISASLSRINTHPVTPRILRSLYSWLSKQEIVKPSLETVGASILTIMDLYSENLGVDEPLSHSGLKMLKRGLLAISDKLVLRKVNEAFLSILEEEVKQHDDGPAVAVIYSDRPDKFYALKTKLAAAEFEVSIPESLEAMLGVCSRRPPAVIILRLHSSPLVIIKTLQVINSGSLELGAIPTFLMVHSKAVNRLVSLLEMGIEDIVDVNCAVDILVSKIKKAHARREADQEGGSLEGGSGSHGKLSDMGLVDLIQALGNSRRTVRLTIEPESSFADPLVIYMEEGRLTNAKLGDWEGGPAICACMSWTDGKWSIEKISPSEIPSVNITVSNEAILMRACQLLDESQKVPVASE